MPRIKVDMEMLNELKEEGKINDHLYAYFQMMGPKKIAQSGLGTQKNWREGYTKPTIEARTAARRKKNKAARKARQKQK